MNLHLLEGGGVSTGVLAAQENESADLVFMSKGGQHEGSIVSRQHQFSRAEWHISHKKAVQ